MFPRCTSFKQWSASVKPPPSDASSLFPVNIKEVPPWKMIFLFPESTWFSASIGSMLMFRGSISSPHLLSSILKVVDHPRQYGGHCLACHLVFRIVGGDTHNATRSSCSGCSCYFTWAIRCPWSKIPQHFVIQFSSIYSKKALFINGWSEHSTSSGWCFWWLGAWFGWRFSPGRRSKITWPSPNAPKAALSLWVAGRTQRMSWSSWVHGPEPWDVPKRSQVERFQLQ